MVTTVAYSGNKNYRTFSAVCDNQFGRTVLYTNLEQVDRTNLKDDFDKQIGIHNKNKKAIEYLDRYYRGDQPILYRAKKVRPDINNKIVENHAFELVESKTAELVGEPVQYVLRGTDEQKSLLIKELNDYMESEDKTYHDIELCRWRSICGTSYRFVPNDNGQSGIMDETPFAIRIENPADTFVVYYSGSKLPAYSCQTRYDVEGKPYYFIYTQNEAYEIRDDKLKYLGLNGNGMIPVIEYPNNERRLSDIEITIGITDSLNKMESDRINGIEQFVQALMKFKNCEIDKDTFLEMVGLGAVVVKDIGSGVQSDVSMMTAELNQEQSQVAKDDLYQNFLLIQGKAGRQESAGSDTGQAAALRGGHLDSERRAELSEPVFKRSERQFLRVILNRLRIKGLSTLKISDIEIKVTRSKMENMLVKAQVLQILLSAGIEYGRAIKTINLWSDPEEVTIESTPRMDILYPTTVQVEEQEAVTVDPMKPDSMIPNGGDAE